MARPCGCCSLCMAIMCGRQNKCSQTNWVLERMIQLSHDQGSLAPMQNRQLIKYGLLHGYTDFVQMSMCKVPHSFLLLFLCFVLLFPGCPGTHYVVEQDSFILEPLWPQLPDCWDCVAILLLLLGGDGIFTKHPRGAEHMFP